MTSETANSRSEQLKTSLLDNAFDALSSAADAVNRDQGPRGLKEAVLHLANGVELVLKARIAQEHWTLVFANVDQAGYAKIRDGDFVSVDFPKALVRLDNIMEVTIPKASTDHLGSLRKIRNKLMHHTTALDSAQTKSLVAKGMSFCVDFCETQNMLDPDAEGKLREIRMNLRGFQEFVDERMSIIINEANYTLIWECPECLQEALTIDGGVVQCQFCGNNADPQKLADSNSEVEPEDCPECWTEQTFAFVLRNNENGMWACFSCGEHSENYDHCMRCDRLVYFVPTTI